jgi:CheY-like chemotaxis protein
MKKLNSILLIDDDTATNFISKMLIKKSGITNHIETVSNGKQALEYLTNSGKYEKTGIDYPKPTLILLDINMPVMDGWEFVQLYSELDSYQKGEIVIIMLTSSLNPDDKERARNIDAISGFRNKILTMGAIVDIMNEYFPGYVE